MGQGGRLAGVVALADVAQDAEGKPTGEVVEEISSANRSQGGRKTPAAPGPTPLLWPDRAITAEDGQQAENACK